MAATLTRRRRLAPEVRESIVRLYEAAKCWQGRRDADVIDVASSIGEWRWLHTSVDGERVAWLAMRAVRVGLRHANRARLS